jgi:hypothetical protein
VIKATRDLKLGGAINDYMLGKQEIIKRKGLSVDYSTDLLSTEEKLFVKNTLDLINFEKNINDLKIECKTHDDIIDLTEKIAGFQKEIRQIKGSLRSITSERVKACFEPYSGQRRAKTAKSVPITTLRDNLKESSSYAPFNPTMIFQLVGESKLASNYIRNDDDYQNREKLADKLVTTLSDKGYKESVIRALIELYFEYCSLLISH